MWKWKAELRTKRMALVRGNFPVIFKSELADV